MTAPNAAAPAKAAAVSVLRCLSPACQALMAYEVEPDNVLHVDLAWTARSADGVRFFPCPACHGKNVLEEVAAPGRKARQRVARFEP